MKSKGVLLCCWGKVGYGYAAFNLAASLKSKSPLIPITLITDSTAISHLDEHYKAVFDNIIVLGEPVSDPGIFKVSIYDKLPYHYTLYLDVDALCINPIDSLLDELISDFEADPDGKFYRTHVHGWYDQDSEVDMPLMYWARRDVIWAAYNFSDHRLPGTQSSIQFIAKCDRAEKFYANLKHLMSYDYIPLESLKHMWGGTQPDELYLNIQIAKDRLTPDLPTSMWFCDNANFRPHQLIAAGYHFLSFFGVRDRIKGYFTEFYDKDLITTLRGMGYANHLFKSHHIFKDKHAANKVVQVKHKLPAQNIALQKQAESEMFIGKSNKKVNLFISFYKANSVARQNEIMECLKRNISNEYIDSVYVLSESPVGFAHSKMIELSHHRPTMAEVVQYANSVTSETDINIMANSDIYFDVTVSMCKDFNLTGKVLCLSRWELSGRHYDYEYSQDSWIWEGVLNLTGGDYQFGLLGCDNKLAHDLFISGYALFNPSRHVKSFHFHNSNERNYSERTRLTRPYRHVAVGGIDGLKSKRLLLHQPGKVGDIIICLPIAKWYADRGYSVDWLCPEQYHDFQPYVDYVKFISIRSGEYDKEIDLSFGLVTTSKVHALWLRRKPSLDSFVSLKYELSDVPVSEFRKLDYKRNKQKEDELFEVVTKGVPYTLVHGKSDYGSAIHILGDAVVMFQPVPGFNILDWRKVIENASEIHCIDSSLVNFADCLNPGGELFYYPNDKVPMQADRTILVNNWKQLEYVG